MLTTVATIDIALRNVRIHTRVFERILIIYDNLTRRLLRKILVLCAMYDCQMTPKIDLEASFLP